MKQPAAKGFTLLEVLVALAIMAVALGAGVRAVGQGADVAAALADRTLARWVAEDHVALLRARKDYPAVGTREGGMVEAGREFTWTEIASDPPESPFRRVEVHVHYPAADATTAAPPDLALVVMFMLRPLQ